MVECHLRICVVEMYHLKPLWSAQYFQFFPMDCVVSVPLHFKEASHQYNGSRLCCIIQCAKNSSWAIMFETHFTDLEMPHVMKKGQIPPG